MIASLMDPVNRNNIPLNTTKPENPPSDQELFKLFEQTLKRLEKSEEEIQELKEDREKNHQKITKLKSQLKEALEKIETIENELLTPKREKAHYETASELIENEDETGLEEFLKSHTVDFTREGSLFARQHADKPKILKMMCDHCPALIQNYENEILHSANWHIQGSAKSLEEYFEKVLKE